jgi:hypothetical protein
LSGAIPPAAEYGLPLGESVPEFPLDGGAIHTLHINGRPCFNRRDHGCPAFLTGLQLVEQ